MDKLFYEIFELLPRQGPGDELSTRKAFEKLTGLPEYPEILDVGCGVGKQTMALAKLTSGKITALDNHPAFIEILKRKIKKAGCSSRIKCIVGDMSSMDFADKNFDLIWSEGSIFIMGFENALKSWRRFLRSDGYIAVSELVWFKRGGPQEVKDFFAVEYPPMKYYKDIYPVIETAGYKLIDYFPLPDRAWWTDFYTPLEKVIAEKRIEYKKDKNAEKILNALQLETDMHKKYSEYYGYGFYVMQKTN
jgi:ubiquinone/menaquinone biosynthesis C-methylase UbiE